ncbi:hypothetical protein N7493_011030 [Penicillium malachiteum]|uniref:C2H2-type domain-containing protein n=1 Tax=Penicillium malachiteum TaxID=1324776 RepID=A0AAD6HBC1_9EURO|nr:hypothetical protein N7493_011030 [Penicillium malachiteum]
MTSDISNNPPYACSQPGCDRKFLRKEHLRRHCLNHSPEKIYTCEDCPRVFVRRDLYRRHKARHDRCIFYRRPSGAFDSTELKSDKIKSDLNLSEKLIEDDNLETAHMQAQEDDKPEKYKPAAMNLFTPSSISTQQEGQTIDWMFESILSTGNDDWANLDLFEGDLSLPDDALNGEPVAVNVIEDQNNSNNDEEKISSWSSVRYRLLESLNNLDSEVLNSAFFHPENLKMFHGLYFQHYHPHFPMLHRPTFTISDVHPLLLCALVALGSTLAEDKNFFLLGQRVHDALQLTVINNGSFAPPISLWCLQTWLLLQAHGKMMSSRKSFELAQVFHAAILTSMKQSDPSASDRSMAGTEAKKDWTAWIQEESWRRAAFFALCMDAQHACLFGHSPVLSVSDMRMSLPCKEALWECSTPQAWSQMLQSGNLKQPVDFLTTLRVILKESIMPSAYSEYARFIILHGLICLQAHLQRTPPLTLGIEHSESGSSGEGEGSQDSAPEKIPSWKNEMGRALSAWSNCLLALQPSLCLIAAGPLYRMAQITLHVKVIDLLILAKDHNHVSSLQTSEKYTQARGRMYDWASSDSAREAVKFSLLLVRETMFSGQPYRAQEDRIAPRPWCLYIAVLTLWAYGEIKQDNCPSNQDNSREATAEEYMIQMTQALESGLKDCVQVADVAGLLGATRGALANCRWELLQEACQVLENLSLSHNVQE